MAARRFGLDAGDLTAAGGMLAGPDGAPSISYGDLLTGQRRVERVAASEPVRSAQAWRSAGHPAPALGAADVVTGTKRFPSDVRLDGMLHGCVLRPPAFGALLREASTSAAETLAGVQLIRDGEFVGAVAPDRATALRAIGLIDASWDTAPQPATGDLDAYLRSHPADGEGWISPFLHEQGDVEAALAAGPVRIDACYSAAYIAHVPLEPRAAVARWAAGRADGMGGHLDAVPGPR